MHDDGIPGRFDTPWGTIEFTHTDRDIKPEIDVYPRDDGVLEASVERAARDLRRVGRNTDLIGRKFSLMPFRKIGTMNSKVHQP